MAPKTSPFHTSILLIAHTPLASALKACALHVFPECEPIIAAYDITPEMQIENSLGHGLALAKRLHTNQLLVFTDIIGATPSNISKKLMDTLAQSPGPIRAVKMICGANVPSILRALTYRYEPLNKLAELVVEGGRQGIIHISPTV